MTEFLQLVVVGFSTGSAFALVGMSLVIVYRTTGIVNFAQGVFAVIGGLFTFELSDDLPLVLAGESAQIRNRPEVHSAYLGGGPG
jgi:branched-subunit amino acid ABC-type transport system permease component